MDWLGRFTTETPQKLMVKTCKKHDFRSRFSENQSSDTKKLSKIHGKKPWFPLVSGSDVPKKTIIRSLVASQAGLDVHPAMPGLLPLLLLLRGDVEDPHEIVVVDGSDWLRSWKEGVR